MAHEVDFPYTHNLSDLLELLKQSGVDISDKVQEAENLTEYAIAGRYPGVDFSVSKNEYLEAVEIARRVVEWVQELLAS